MADPIRNVAILGSGTTGLITALTFRQELPNVTITAYRGSAISIVGVGDLHYALMEQRRAPIITTHVGVAPQDGYHIEHQAFVRFLERVAEERGIRFVDAKIESAETAQRWVQRLRPKPGQLNRWKGY